MFKLNVDVACRAHLQFSFIGRYTRPPDNRPPELPAQHSVPVSKNCLTYHHFDSLLICIFQPYRPLFPNFLLFKAASQSDGYLFTMVKRNSLQV